MDDSRTNRRALGAILLGLCLVYWIGIFSATHVPLKPLPGGRSRSKWFDKAEHCSAYAGLTVLLCATGATWIAAPSRLYATVFGLVAAYGAVDELTQLFVPGRSADIRDWVADITGAGVGILVVAILRAASAHRARHLNLS